jgi:hypothetical protein
MGCAAAVQPRFSNNFFQPKKAEAYKNYAKKSSISGNRGAVSRGSRQLRPNHPDCDNNGRLRRPDHDSILELVR